MLIIVFLYAAFNLASSAPVLPSTPDLDAALPLTIFGREPPTCANVARYRTIQEIVWSCLATIFACSWVAVHPNVPGPQDSKWQKFWKKVLVMVYAILAPEFVIGWALRQWWGAVRHAIKYNQKHHGVTPPSSYLQWYIRDRFYQDVKPCVWTITHGFLLEMHGLVDDSGKTVRSVDREILDPLDLLEEEINDKSKGDFLTKTVVVLQTTWFIFQCLARWLQHLPVTELEVITLAFALLNIGTYALWWNKPQGMGLAIRMDRYTRPKKDPQEQNETADDVGNATKSGAQPINNQQSVFLGRAAEVVDLPMCHLSVLRRTVTMAFNPRRLRSLTFKDISGIVKGPSRPLAAMLTRETGECGHIFYSSKPEDSRATLSTVTLGSLFGGLHLIPLWSSSFPSSPEKLLWKLCAILITTQPLLFVLLASTVLSRIPRNMDNILTLPFFAVYFTARAILIVLAFTTLRELPPDALRNIAWTTFIPHF